MTPNTPNDAIVTLNIGGKIFQTKQSTLSQTINNEENLFTNLFKSNFKIQIDSEKNIFFDRDGTYFHYLLNYLREKGELKNVDFPIENSLIISQLIHETRYFGLNQLTTFLLTQIKEKKNFNFSNFSEIRGNNIILLNDKKMAISIGDNNEWSSIFVDSPILQNVTNFIEFDVILPSMRSISIPNQIQCEIGIQKKDFIKLNQNSFKNNLYFISNLSQRRNRIGIEVDFRKEYLTMYINGIRYHSINLLFYGKNDPSTKDNQWHFVISMNARDFEISIYDQFIE
eukprot:gene9359-1570_t